MKTVATGLAIAFATLALCGAASGGEASTATPPVRLHYRLADGFFGDMIEVFLDQRRSLVSRWLQHPTGRLALLAQDASVGFGEVQIRRLGVD